MVGENFKMSLSDVSPNQIYTCMITALPNEIT